MSDDLSNQVRAAPVRPPFQGRIVTIYRPGTAEKLPFANVGDVHLTQAGDLIVLDLTGVPVFIGSRGCWTEVHVERDPHWKDPSILIAKRVWPDPRSPKPQ